MYSPADLPSSTRAAPAKNVSTSLAWYISSLLVSDFGLPVSRDSTSTISSARESMAAASLLMACERSYGVVSRHDSKAVAAAPKARSTSSSRDNGAEAYTWPVEGSITS